VRASTASEGALENRAQSLSLGGGKALDLCGRLVETLKETLALLPSVGCEHHLFHPPIPRVGAALDQPTRLQSVDDARDVRRIAVESLGYATHRDGCLRVEPFEYLTLSLGQAELGGHRRKAPSFGAEHLKQQRPNLGCRGFHADILLDFLDR